MIDQASDKPTQKDIGDALRAPSPDRVISVFFQHLGRLGETKPKRRAPSQTRKSGRSR